MDIATIASYVLYFTAGFVFLPAGRDIVSHKTAILPGESDMRKAMTMTKVGTRTFMWGVWGLNHCMMSFLKIWANYNKDVPLLKILTVQTALCLAYLVGQRSACLKAKADLTGFAAIFTLEICAISYLAYA